MSGLAVIVPVKSAGRKSRLSAVLGRGEREEFTRILLSQVLHALRSSGLLRRCYVVSPDRDILEFAAKAGARPVREPSDAGVNAAVAAGLRAAGEGSDALVIPADLHLLLASELKRLLAARRSGSGVAIAPSVAFDGTNALLLPGGSRLRLSYDDDSFWNHLSGAARERLAVRVCTEPGLMFDVDSSGDLRKLAESGSTGPSATFARRALR